MTSKQKKMLVLVGALVLALVAVVIIAVTCGGSDKLTITVSVTHMDGKTAEFTVKTDKETLADALLEEKLIEGHEDSYGLYVDVVDGERADAAANQAWVFTKDGQQVDTGVSATKIADGDHYEFSVLTW